MRYGNILLIALALLGSLQLALSSDLLSELRENLDRREKWADGKRFVWDVTVAIDSEMSQQAYSEWQKIVSEIGGTLLEGRSYTYKTNFQINAARKGNRLVVSGKGTNGRVDTPFFLFVDDGLYIIGAYPIYAMREGSKPDRITEAYVFACRQNLLYNYIFTQPLLLWDPGYQFFYGLLVHVSPLRFYAERPTLTQRGNLLQLKGQGTLLHDEIHLLTDASGIMSQITCISPRPVGYKKSVVYSFRRFRKVDGISVPSQIDLEKLEKSPEQRRKVSITFNLRSIETITEKDVSIDLPIGTLVSDFRMISKEWDSFHNSDFFRRGEWDRVISYPWRGSLPDDKQLEKLAYQQGNLVPLETPQRRYSPWLFLPALLFFALAAYFYFRNKRR